MEGLVTTLTEHRGAAAEYSCVNVLFLSKGTYRDALVSARDLAACVTADQPRLTGHPGHSSHVTHVTRTPYVSDHT